MPELPAVRALAERLDRAFSGAVVEGVQVLQFSALKTFAVDPASLQGRELERVTSRGKYLVFELPERNVIVHLSQAGRIVVEGSAKATRPKGAVMRLVFSGRGSLLLKEFGSERKAAWWVLERDEPGPLEDLGPDPHSEDFGRFLLSADDGRRLHTMLRDQRTVAGIGRGLADDILHAARLSPFDSLGSLSPEERRELLRTVRAVLDGALEHERAREGGLPNKLDDTFVVHGRHSAPCPVCNETLRRVSYGSHDVTYCPACQTGGRVLADRRLSRLLK